MKSQRTISILMPNINLKTAVRINKKIINTMYVLLARQNKRLSIIIDDVRADYD